MSFFIKGDFKIQESWDKPPSRASNSREKSRQKQKRQAFINAAKNIIDPSPDILDEELSKRILKQFAAEIPPQSIKSEKKVSSKETDKKLPPKQKNPTSSSENDLLTSMAARLKTVEMTCKNQRQEIRDKNETIQKLKSENTFLKGFREDASKEYEKMKAIQSENEDLQKKVTQMEEYLKKYGLKWVGNKIEGKLQHQKMKKAIAKGNYQYRLPSEIDINTLKRRIQQLNGGLHAEGMGTQIYQQHGVHKFRPAEPLPLGFFANGIAIKGYKFFPYKSKQSLQILGDLVDGYFPFVLKAKYPNGVFLKVVDKVVEKYDEEASQQSINTFDSNQKNQFKPPSKEEFLNKLPKQIIKNGKIINIRGEIQKRMNGETQKQNAQIIQQAQEEQNEDYEKSDGITIFKTECYKRMMNKHLTEQEICTLKIRNQQGQVIILHLERHSKVDQIYLWLKKINKTHFKIMSNFPRRSYESTEQSTLEQLGLFPNAMLHLHRN